MDYLAGKFDYPIFKEEHGGVTSKHRLFDEMVILCKPQTFMNRSGYCVSRLLSYYKIALDDVVIIQDDLDIEFGKNRIRELGNAGGHNGIASIIEQVGTNGFKRLKIGISRPPANQDATEHVLSRFKEGELAALSSNIFPECEEKLKEQLS